MANRILLLNSVIIDKPVIFWYAVIGGVSRPSGAVPTNAGGYTLYRYLSAG